VDTIADVREAVTHHRRVGDGVLYKFTGLFYLLYNMLWLRDLGLETGPPRDHNSLCLTLAHRSDILFTMTTSLYGLRYNFVSYCDANNLSSR